MPEELESAQTYPVAEIFGPTIQGEGALAGKVTHFVRFGGCDYKCLWCDSAHAVLPESVKGLNRLTQREIALQLFELPGTPDWITLSGGNPAMHKGLEDLIEHLHLASYKVAVETQGTKFPEWLHKVDHITCSPKPPSSGMVNFDDVDRFLETAPLTKTSLKVVVFDDLDYEYAVTVHQEHPEFPFYLSVGTLMGGLFGNFRNGEIDRDIGILERYKWLVEKVLEDSDDGPMGNVSVFPQLHVLLWGHVRGR